MMSSQGLVWRVQSWQLSQIVVLVRSKGNAEVEDHLEDHILSKELGNNLREMYEWSYKL